jgi:hydrogenase expression/formation protein HypC
VPEAQLGNYVIVHAGFAISTLSESEAKETLDILNQLDSFQQELGN